MAKQARAADGLVKVQRELASWRERHGGRGRSIPTGLWSAAAEVAAVQGVSATASALGVSRARLARRLQAHAVGAPSSVHRTTRTRRERLGPFSRHALLVPLRRRPDAAPSSPGRLRRNQLTETACAALRTGQRTIRTARRAPVHSPWSAEAALST
jgi:hypothetical protein